MTRLFIFSFALLACSNGLAAAENETAEQAEFARDVKPILVKRCFRCHSSVKQESGFRLDSVAAIMKGGESGPAIVPGSSRESLLFQAVTGSDLLQMPPEGEPLTAKEIDVLRRWIDQGAKSPLTAGATAEPVHWAFRQPARPPVPKVANGQWVLNPIDAFVADQHQQRNLTPVPAAPKHVWLRRVYLDLIGLPPTPEEMQAFLADESDAADVAAVNRLLDSPHYGERWGRHWMDVWRYSDWSGYKQEIRNSQPHIWRWRDWIVQSLNEDKGYDRMVLEMLAADEIAPDDHDALRATGFLVRNWYKFNRHAWLDNTIDHTSKAFLGVTFGCARCHDHMYDPISQQDYFRFRAFFEPHNVRTDRVPGVEDTTKDGLPRAYDADTQTPTYLFVRGDERRPDKEQAFGPGLPTVFGIELAVIPVSLPPTAYYPSLRPFVQQETLDKAAADVTKAETALAQAKQVESPKQDAVALAEKVLASATADLVAVRARIEADIARFATPPKENASQLRRSAAQAERESACRKAEEESLRAEQSLTNAKSATEISPDDKKAADAFAAAEKQLAAARKKLEEAHDALDKPADKYSPLGPMYPTTSSGRRAALARWIADKQNPLTARVSVNHIWLRHFGTPLVGSVFEFGLNGQPPTHPELLDWLAVELMDKNWSMKHVHRMIVTSNTYRMQSSSDQAHAENVRIDPDNRSLWRMNARRMEAEVVRDSVLHVAGQLDTTMGGPELSEDSGLATHRRSLYYRHAYEKQMTFLKLFDAANVEECYRRSESVIPQQALALANSPLALAQSRVLAKRLSDSLAAHKTETNASAAFVIAAFNHILGRPPTTDEQTECETFLAEQTKRLADKTGLTAFTSGAASAVKPSADPQQRARENLVHVLLNHNDFVTIR